MYHLALKLNRAITVCQDVVLQKLLQKFQGEKRQLRLWVITPAGMKHSFDGFCQDGLDPIAQGIVSEIRDSKNPLGCSEQVIPKDFKLDSLSLIERNETRRKSGEIDRSGNSSDSYLRQHGCGRKSI